MRTMRLRMRMRTTRRPYYDKNDEAEPIEDDLDIIAEMIELDSDDLKEE